MEALTTIQKLIVFSLPILLAITVHEAAHGWSASRLGDSTAKMLGRVTFNPFKRHYFVVMRHAFFDHT